MRAARRVYSSAAESVETASKRAPQAEVSVVSMYFHCERMSIAERERLHLEYLKLVFPKSES